MTTSCIYCKKDKIIKYGCRETRNRGKIQLYLCKKCGKRFCEDEGFKYKKKSTETIIDTIELYTGGGCSSRFLSQFLHLSRNTILNWVYEYSEKISRFTNRFKPKVIPRIHIDELFLKMCETMFYIWDAICADTKFAFHFFSDHRGNKDAEELIKQFLGALEMVFDGAFQYPAVIKKLLGIWWYYHHTHRCKDFKDKKHNNIVERLQNFIRSKTHQRRGYKGKDTGTLHVNLLFIYYNFVRVHSVIRQTPAEKAGLIEYFDANTEVKRWKFLIKRATEQSYSSLTLFTTLILGQSQR
jgi:transposase-like protein